jgi:hypothetical protein
LSNRIFSRAILISWRAFCFCMARKKYITHGCQSGVLVRIVPCVSRRAS